MAWDPSGLFLATGGGGAIDSPSDYTATVWNAETGEEVLALSGHGGPITSVAWSPDNERLGTASEDNTAKDMVHGRGE